MPLQDKEAFEEGGVFGVPWELLSCMGSDGGLVPCGLES
jgi:hypothetical protein